jgi:hypothetical protein
LLASVPGSLRLSGIAAHGGDGSDHADAALVSRGDFFSATTPRRGLLAAN